MLQLIIIKAGIKIFIKIYNLYWIGQNYEGFTLTRNNFWNRRYVGLNW